MCQWLQCEQGIRSNDKKNIATVKTTEILKFCSVINFLNLDQKANYIYNYYNLIKYFVFYLPIESGEVQ